MYRATLECGAVLLYEERDFVPELGDVVPCRRHGYCTVEGGVQAGPAGRRGHALPRARPRARWELVDFLRREPVTTVHALRRRRFTLRMVAVVEREGLVDVDLCTGSVAVRAAFPRGTGDPGVG